MLGWRKKSTYKDSEKIPEDIQKTIADEDVKHGYIEITRAKKNAKNRSQSFYIAQRPIADIKNTRIEDLLSEDYGGGDYFIKLHKTENGKNSYIASFSYLIDGPSTADEDGGNVDPFKQLAIDVAKKQMLGSGDNNILLEIVKTLLSNNSNPRQNDLSDLLDNVVKIKAITSPDVPVIPPENETVALISAAANIGSAWLNSRGNQSQPSNTPKTLTELPLPNNPTLIIPNQPNANLDINLSGNNGNQPEFISPQKAFATFFLKPYKEAVNEGASNDDIVGMIESMTVSCLYWLRPEEYHDVVKVFVDGYSQTDLPKINQGFETIMVYGGIPKERADVIKGLLLTLYQTRYAASDKTKTDGEGVEDGV